MTTHPARGLAFALAVGASAMLCQHVQGQITVAAEARQTRALVDTSDLLGGVNPRHSEQLHQPLALGGWDDAAVANAPLNTVTSGHAAATQSSDMTGTLLSASLSVSADAFSAPTPFSPVFSHTSARSFYSVDMNLTAGVYRWDWTFDPGANSGNVNLCNGTSIYLQIKLLRGTTVYENGVVGTNSQAYTLPAGSYHLEFELVIGSGVDSGLFCPGGHGFGSAGATMQFFPSPGACCRGAICVTTTQDECPAQANQQFRGAGTICNIAGNNKTPCCKADFNQDGTVNVADIFAFLSAWFALNSSADFDGLGGVTVADIFAFLSAWFGGC